MSRYARHLLGRQGPTNPFPGLKALERRLGRRIPHRLGSNEGLDMPHRALTARFGDEFAELARGYGDAEALGHESTSGLAKPRDASGMGIAVMDRVGDGVHRLHLGEDREVAP